MNQEETKEDKLAKIMRGKDVMQKVDQKNFGTGNVDPAKLEQQLPSEGQQQAMPPQGGGQPQMPQMPQGGGQPQMPQQMQEQVGLEPQEVDPNKAQVPDLTKLDEQQRKQVVENSNLPDNVKKAMVNNPTSRPDPSVVANSGTFSIHDVQQHVQQQVGQNQQQQQPQQPQSNGGGQGMLNEQTPTGGDKQMLNEDRMRNIIKEEFINLFFNENIKESLIKEVSEKAAKEALREIKNKLRKKKTSSNGKRTS